MEENYVLKLKNVSKEYFGNKVLKEVNLNVKAGEIHALVGGKRRRKIHTDEYIVWHACYTQYRRIYRRDNF
ncbi:MAG: hypothetical protein ACOX3L_12835 [Lutisporaceae bacterium]